MRQGIICIQFFLLSKGKCICGRTDPVWSMDQVVHMQFSDHNFISQTVIAFLLDPVILF